MKREKISSFEIRNLSEITNLITCVAKHQNMKSGVPFLSSQNVKNGEIVWEKFKFISIDAQRTY